MSLFYAPDIEKTWELPEEEAAHCLRVLRLGVGDQLEVTDGKGKLFKSRDQSDRSFPNLLKLQHLP